MLLLGVVAIGLLAILLPFYGTLLWALIISMQFLPLHRRLARRMRGQRSTPALLTLLVVFVVVLLPFALLSMALAKQGALLFGQLQSGQLDPAAFFRRIFEAMPSWLAGPMRQLGLTDFDDLQRRLGELLSDGSRLLASEALRLGQNTLGLVTSLLIMLYLAFFMIRDGDRLAATLRDAVPLRPDVRAELSSRFTIAMGATVRGTLLVAVIQGALGGLAFWFLGLPGALLWAVVMGFVSLLPAVGSALVWFPVVLYYLAAGEIPQAIGLAVWGVLVIGLVDNLLRPILVGKETKMPDWVVMITTLGGISVFGINGFVLGPVIAAMFFAIWPLVVPGARAAPGLPQAVDPPLPRNPP